MSAERLSVTLVSILFFYLPISCADRIDSQQKVTLGIEAPEGRFPAVALLKKDFSGEDYVFCSGVLLDSDVILTAAHCSVDDVQNPYSPADIRVVVGEIYPMRSQNSDSGVKTIVVHPEYTEEGMFADSRGLVVPGKAHDLAIWKLEKEFTQYKAMNIAASSDLKLGDLPTLVGYGLRSTWATGSEAILNYASSIYKSEYVVSRSEKVLVDGRLITKKVDHVIESKSDHEFFLGGSDLPDTCGGDSGGPVFLGTDQDLTLVGLTSRGISTCDKGGIYTFVPAYRSWIDETVASLQN